MMGQRPLPNDEKGVRFDFHRTYNAQWDHDNQTWWERRSLLEKAMMVCLALLVVGSFGFLFYLTFESSNNSDFCKSPQCLIVASRFSKSIDSNADPCVDFYQFSCGTREKNVNFLQQTEVTISNQLKEILLEPAAAQDHVVVAHQKNFFQKCVASTESWQNLQILNETLQEIDGWPVVVDYIWKANRFVWTDAILQLRKRGYAFATMLDISVVRDPEEIDAYILQINVPKIEEIQDAHKFLYLRYMIEVATFFEAAPQLATYEMEYVLDFMDKLSSLNDSGQFERVRLEKVQQKYPDIDWLSFINSFLEPESGVSGDHYVLIPSNDTLKTFFLFLKTVLKRTQANYIVWRVIEEMMPFMPKKLRDMRSNYDCATNLKTYRSRDRFEFCKHLVYDNFYLPFTEVMYARRYLSISVQETIKNVSLKVINKIFDFVKSDDLFIDDDSRQIALNKINSTAIIVGGIDANFYNDTIFDSYSINLEEDTAENATFFELYLKSRNAHLNFLFSLCRNPFEEARLFVYPSTMEMKLFETDNVLAISAALVQAFAVDEDDPSFLIFGTLGNTIGRKLAQLVPLPSNASECFRNTIGFDITYDAWSEETFLEEEFRLPGINENADRLFWISAFLPVCMSFDKKITGRDMECTLCKSDAFAKVFHCVLDENC